ncbi:MAG: biotin transporter BioY [Chloroflexota bacterium]|nr:biotin transporter BioY [Chloroflexota bacterium]
MHSLTLWRTREATWLKALGVLLFAVATALSAQIKVFLPFSPVPLTFQVLLVIASGFVLGARGGLLAQLLYLQAILWGAPLTATGIGGPAAFVSPTAGYLLAFPAAAALAGWLASGNRSFSTLRRLVAGVVALAVIYLCGMAWLSGFVGGMGNAWRMGVAPFVLADALKIAVVTAMLALGES